MRKLTDLFSNVNLDEWARVATICTAAVAILGLALSWQTLRHNFLNKARISLKLGKSALALFHDKALGLAPAIDVFCTLLNAGARSQVVDRLKGVLIHKGTFKQIGFEDYLFLRKQHAVCKRKTNEAEASEQLQDFTVQDEYSHPLVLNKYCEISKFVMFKALERSFPFETGPYSLTIEAICDERRLAKDTVEFEISSDKAEDIRKKRENGRNEATEISLK